MRCMFMKLIPKLEAYVRRHHFLLLIIIFIAASCASTGQIKSMQVEINQLKTEMNEIKSDQNDETDEGNVQVSPVELAQKRGLTWGSYDNMGVNGYARVSCHGDPKLSKATSNPHNGTCNPYNGDTLCTERRPLLCINVNDRLPKPYEMVTTETTAWTGGKVKLIKNVLGTDLTSHEVADKICRDHLGSGWKMAEHEDGTGWGFWAKGTVNKDTRFWVSISDQPGNCWGKDPHPRYRKYPLN